MADPQPPIVVTPISGQVDKAWLKAELTSEGEELLMEAPNNVSDLPLPPGIENGLSRNGSLPALSATTDENLPGPRPVIRHLVFSGGGIRGLAYVGCLKALEERADLQLVSCSGCSVGSIMATLVTLGYKGDELYDFVLHFEYGFVKNISFLRAFSNYGLESGQKIHTFIGLMIKKRIGDPYITFAQLYAKHPIKLTINACCLNTYQCQYFNHITAPDMPVLTAIRMSIAVPVMIAPVIHEGQYFVDGGIMDNFPIGQAPDTAETIGFSLEVMPELGVSFAINSVESFLFHTFGCIYNQLNLRKFNEIKEAHIVHVDIPGVSSLAINLNESQRMYLFNTGYDLTYRYLDKLCQGRGTTE